MRQPLLDNIVWHCLAGEHSKFSSGTTDVRRYASGFSPIIGFLDPTTPNFPALAPFCAAGESFYTDIWSGPPPHDWRIESESTMFKMVWEGSAPNDDALDATPLDATHAQQALELATQMRPGPFGIRTIELGEYFGYFENGRLIGMAGERMQAGRFREISGVCTLPEHQGRGLARKLMNKLLCRQVRRGQTPFLHVMSANKGARDLYERMGFRNYLESVVRVITPR
jgi:ribosomal protein S18 acetylase RimI-like enzyme